MKKILLYAFILLMIFFIGTGSIFASGGKQAGKTLVVSASQDWIKDIDRTLAQEFEKETGTKIDFQVNPDDQYTSIVRSKLMTGEGPDIFYCNSGIGIIEYMPDKYFADLSGEPWISSLEEWAVKSATYKGRVIGLNMWSIDGWGIVYNSEIYSKLGLKVPRNYAEFVSNCEKIMAAGITPIYEPGKDTWHGCLWLLEIADFVNRKYPGLYEKLNTAAGKFADIPEALTLTEQYKELETKGFFGKNYMSQNFDGGAEALASGKFAMFLTYTAWANENSPNFPSAKMTEWGMFPVPLAGNNTWSHSGGGILTIINKESKNVEEAKAYFRFLARKENAQRYYTAKPKLATSAVKGVTVAPLKAMNDIIANATGGIGPDFAASIPFYNADDVGRPYRELLIGTKTAREVLQTIDATRKSMFEVTGY